MLTAAEPRAEARADRRWAPAAAVLVLLLAYAALLAMGDSRTGSVSDVGGKLATAKVLAEGDGTTPDVGYWAEDLDPDGTFHPLANTALVGGHWVQATSIPYALVTGVLWRLAGPTGVAALSMLAAVASAIAARALARRLGAETGWAAFWLTGIGGPLGFYALDGWEHAPGVALGLWAVVLALDPRTRVRAAAAGALFTAAFVLRADLAVYALAFGVATLAVGEVRRRWTSHPTRLAAAVLGAAIPVVLNAVVEQVALGGPLRAERAAGGASVVAADLGQRLTDSILTGFGLFADDSPTALLLGLLLFASLLVLAARVAGASWATDQLTKVAGVAAVLLYLLRFADGLGFVPGAVAAAPIVALAVAARRRPDTWVVLGTALGAVPLVWLFQWSGNHVPQWGGRYLLMTTALLVVVAAVAIEQRGLRAGPTPLLLGLTVAVTAMGLAWHVDRTRTEGHLLDAVTSQPGGTVVVAVDAQMGREVGSGYGEVRWLSADAGVIDQVLDIAVAAAPTRIVVVEGDVQDRVDSVPGYRFVDEEQVASFVQPIRVHTFLRG